MIVNMPSFLYFSSGQIFFFFCAGTVLPFKVLGHLNYLYNEVKTCIHLFHAHKLKSSN
ncbi:hypothetical protein GLOIN_2v1504802 [Rhizophagus irregularis DAOM 181602=DAOM 197198]|uniref:Uncharacterized protein n=1 Tax=Rhizophagus irregularis (strain DAOM 181602 / DAOM 197198 / MUCL 43194) TaxID=747089 RepID=A0A2P4QVR2_RHIID|nr:hypothetical protein GLOIN_2v1504802 [Rhizophagus irregularis DAOM 181602=DAOM 197198]POG81719.1 hypothetical protein GLOIN_2v1504802 [Rhizophagus irregularis DAOM 181602=DAOM 197198]|eukprot:XP_025188585.1 hypothetical protein GLOIN_2v1504802 [Rhizophagus irregularis DAOM 181602=DAOM 197198]